MIRQRTIQVKELLDSIDKNIEGGDEVRTHHLQGLQTFRNLKAQALKREQERLTKKLSSDDPRLAILAKRVGANEHLLSGLKREGLRARTEAPSVDKDTWILHGHVRDREGAPLPNLTMALYDDGEKWIKEFGYGCTDGSGYFKITYRSGKTVEGQPSDAGSATKMLRGGLEAFIRIFDRKGTCLYVDKDALTPELGTVDYREIIISREGEICKPPEDVVPESGLSPVQPGRKKKSKLEDIKGVGHVLAKKLREAGIRDLKTFVETDDTRLKEVLGKGVNVAEMKRQAVSFLKETD